MSHLSQAQRYTISVMYDQGHTQTAIAEAIGRHKSVVNREIKRNKDQRGSKYDADLAQRKYDKRLKSKAKHVKLDEAMRQRVKEGLGAKYSPEQIVGNARRQGLPMVSHETIYKMVWSDKRKGGILHHDLRHQGRKYQQRGNTNNKRGVIPGRVDISERPREVETRERLGDLEIDTIIGKNRKGAIVTINDRKTGYLWMRLLGNREAAGLAEATVKALERNKHLLKTITSDNGKEFAAHEDIATQLGVKFYFARPYHSWERGSNENLNGLIRQYIPKGTDFTTLDDEFVKFVQDQLNNRPRKRHNFESPSQVLNRLSNLAGEVAFVA